MTTVLLYVLPIAATIVLAVGGMIYGTQKIASIWMVFGAVVMYALAGCLYWQQLAISQADNPPFAVAIETALVVQERERAHIFGEYNQKFLSPIPIALFVRVANNQNIPSDVTQFKIEVEMEKRFGLFPQWLKTISVPAYMPLVWATPPPARRITLAEPRLEQILRDRPLQPHETLRGWVLLDAPAEFNEHRRPLTFRISVQDASGHGFTNIDSGPTGEENIYPKRGITMGKVIDITGYKVHHFGEPLN